MPNQLKLVIKILSTIRVGKQEARSRITKQMMVLKILASTVANYILESVDSRANQSVSTVKNLVTLPKIVIVRNQHSKSIMLTK
jgi:hypothetical protein